LRRGLAGSQSWRVSASKGSVREEPGLAPTPATARSDRARRPCPEAHAARATRSSRPGRPYAEGRERLEVEGESEGRAQGEEAQAPANRARRPRSLCGPQLWERKMT
jgi:hypothetical protein